MERLDSRRSDAVWQSLGNSTFWRHFLWSYRYAYVPRCQWRALSRRHSVRRVQRPFRRRTRGGLWSLLALCRPGLDVHFPTGLFIVRPDALIIGVRSARRRFPWPRLGAVIWYRLKEQQN